MYPAQVRYQYNNPIIAFRIPREEYERHEEVAKNSWISLAELARRALRGASKIKEAREEGYKEGFEAAKRELEKSEKEAHERGLNKGVKKEKEGLKPRLKEALKRGYEEGLKDARSRYEITYPCAVCGEMMTMYPNQNDHQKMRELMVQYGWKHNNCEE